jgi:chromosome partitioning protein
MASTIAVLSQKGGTGKTTATRTLTDVFRRVGLRVLAVDLDPQGNLSDYLDVDPEASPTIGDVLSGRAKARSAVHDGIIPANLGLAEAELALGGKMGRELALKKALREVKNDYDLILIDCPPALGLLTVNALVAARHLLVPLQCEFFALEGLSQLLQTVERIRVAFNPGLSILGVALTMFDRRNNLSQAVSDDVRACLGAAVFETVVPRNVRLSEAPSHGLPALIYDLKCPGSEAYVRLARELIGRLPQLAVAA